jgi:glycosyltransferase involved in cell wall biosynthesis
MVLTVSDYIKRRVSTIMSKNKIKTVYNGIDLNSFSIRETFSVSRETLGFSMEDFIMVYSGRINKDKGVSELIDAMLLLKNTPKIKLLILGSTFFDDSSIEDNFVNTLRNKAAEIKDRIVFTGFIPYKQVPSFLHIANIAVLPSMWEEPFGLTVVEAMAMGLPLITTRSGGIPEICEGVATIVERDDIVNNLTSAIIDLYEHPEKRNQMSMAAIKRAKLFDKEEYAKHFFAALNSL